MGKDKRLWGRVGRIVGALAALGLARRLRREPPARPDRGPLTHLADFKGTWRWADQRYSRRRRLFHRH